MEEICWSMYIIVKHLSMSIFLYNKWLLLITFQRLYNMVLVAIFAAYIIIFFKYLEERLVFDMQGE